jgi:hypothetical protein
MPPTKESIREVFDCQLAERLETIDERLVSNLPYPRRALNILDCCGGNLARAVMVANACAEAASREGNLEEEVCWVTVSQLLTPGEEYDA